MSNTFPSSPDHNETWDNPTTGESFRFDRHRGWINQKGVRYDGDSMTGTLVVPDTRINGGLLSADAGSDASDQELPAIFDILEPATYYYEPAAAFSIWRDPNTDKVEYLFIQGNGRHFILRGDGDVLDGVDTVPWIKLDGAWNPRFKDMKAYSVLFHPTAGHKWVIGKTWASGNRTEPQWHAHPGGTLYDGISTNWPYAGNWTDYGIPQSQVYGSGLMCAAIHEYQDGSWVIIMAGKGDIILRQSDSFYSTTKLEFDYDGIPEANKGHRWLGVAVNEDRWVLGGTHGGRTRYSTDRGLNWNSGPKLSADNQLNIQCLEFGVSGDSPILLAGTNQGHYYSLDDGDTWQSGTGVLSSKNIYDIKYRAGMWMACGKDFVAASPNGIDGWVECTKKSGANITDAVVCDHDGYRWCVMGSNLRMYVADYLDLGEPPESAEPAKLYWNGETVSVLSERSTFLHQEVSSLSSSPQVKYLGDSAPVEDHLHTSESGELWYQPSTNTLHVRDSDDWVALFQ